MNDLADFLLARIAEDEHIARAAADSGYEPKWQARSLGMPAVEAGLDVWSSDIAHGVWECDDDQDDDCAEMCQRAVAQKDHIATHDPARVLAECDAKRRIIEWHKNWPVLIERQPDPHYLDPAFGAGFDDAVQSATIRMTRQFAWATEQQYRETFGTEPPTGPILRLLALPYADHPDYRDEWRP